MTALHDRATSGAGQMIDLAIIEPIMAVLGNQALVYDQLGIVQPRLGNRSSNNPPRNTYRTRDGRWVAVSTSADRIAARMLELVGHPEVVREPWFATGFERAQHAEFLDELVGGWIAERDQAEVLRAFEEAGAAISPVYDIAEAMADLQYRALGTFVELEDDDLGHLRMQTVLYRMSRTQCAVRFAGRRIGQDNAEVFGEMGLDVQELRADSAI